MKHLKRFNEELSPQKYDTIARGARDRGDGRGRRVANTATDLKFRDYVGQAITFKKKGLTSRHVTSDKISEVQTNNSNWVSFLSKETKTDIVFKLGADKKSILSVDLNGAGFEVDRKTANLVTKAFKEFCKKDFKPQALAQI
jgi:hypothetical protein